MAGGATEWAWQQSRAKNGSLIVLLAIADEIDNGREAVMSVAQLAAKAHLSERAVQAAVSDLGRLGLMSATRVKGGSAYRLAMVDHVTEGADSAPLPASKGAESAPPQNLHPAESAPQPEKKPQVKPKGAESAPPSTSDVLDLGSVVSGGKSRSRDTPAPPRDDVERLCAHLASLIVANGSKPPVIDKRWRDEARRMIDIDGRAEDKAHALIDWCQQDHFWRQNIHSMPTFRRQYDKLRLAANAEWEKKKRPARNGHQPTPDEFAALRDNWARPLDAMEAGNDPRGNDGPHAVHRGRLPAAED